MPWSHRNTPAGTSGNIMPSNDMRAFLMTWSSERMPEESLDRMFRDLETDPTGADPSHRFDWTIGAHKQVKAGDMAIFYRQASEHNGSVCDRRGRWGTLSV